VSSGLPVSLSSPDRTGRPYPVRVDDGTGKAGRARRFLVWAPPIAWAVLIFAFSAQPDLRFVPDETLDFVVRKIGHMAVFGVLTLLLWRAIATTSAPPTPWLAALVITILYAVSDELHQAGVIGRYASPLDVGFDAVGAVIAILAVALVQSVRARRRPSA
jgi:VanZ family protein